MIEEDVPAFGKQLRQHREAAGLSQEELAERAGLSTRGVSDLERGERRHPYPHTLRRLIEALGLTEDDRAALIALVPRRGRASAPQRTAAGTGVIPIPTTPLVGRRREVAAVVELFVHGARLVTLTGTGGTGKTRVATQVAQELANHFADGVVFVGLGALSEHRLLADNIEQALGLAEAPGTNASERIIAHLRASHLLLVLDNLEHLLPATPLVTHLLGAVPGLQVLTTSRVPLGLYGEHEYRVPPLELPQATRDGMESEAVQLYVQRARAVRPDLPLTAESRRIMASICARLDGLPLAIELAASRSKLFSPAALLDRLENRLDILTRGPRDLPARQRTLRQTLDWSYDLLTSQEQSLFARLGVFVGSFDTQSVEALGDRGTAILEELEGLANQSLLEYAGTEGPRFRMLETVREYALARLAESGEMAEVRRCHAHYYFELAAAAEGELIGAEQTTWMDLLDTELGNLRVALAWLVREQPAEALRMTVALEEFWHRRGRLREAWGLLEPMLAGYLASDRIRARGLVVGGSIIATLGDCDRADALLGEGLAIYGRLRDKRGTAAAMAGIGALAFHRQDFLSSRHLRGRALALYEEIDDRPGIAACLNMLGLTALLAGDLDEAESLLSRGVEASRLLDDGQGTAYVLLHLAGVILFRHDYAATRPLLEEALRLAWEAGGDLLTARCVMLLAVVVGAGGEHARAVQLIGAGEAVLERAGTPRLPAEQAATERFVTVIRGPLDAAGYRAAYAAGRALGLENAVTLALGGS